MDRAGGQYGPVQHELTAAAVGSRTQRPGRDAEVVAAVVEQPEVAESPRPVLEALQQRPACSHDTVALSDHVVDLEDQLDACRWPTQVDALDVHTEDGPHAHVVSAQKQVR